MTTQAKRLAKHTVLAALACCLIHPVSSAQAIGLKEQSIISDDTIKLGDIFYDLPRDEDRILGAAPRPGKDMVLGARTLLRIALALDLPWRPASNAERVVLSRAATVIEHDMIESSLMEAIKEDGILGEYEVTLPAHYQEIILPPDQPATMEITDISVESERDKFVATVAAPSADNPIQHFRITGQLDPVITVPVLAENIQSGRVIRPSDIKTIKIKERDFSSDTVVDTQALVGMTARRMLIAGRPVRDSEVVAPEIIERGSLVFLSLVSGPLQLTTQVKALENGAKGDIIRVVNTTSNQTLQAKVTGENQVAVVQN